MLENPDIPYNAVEHYMGHEINSRTKRIYDHVRDVTLYAASEALSSGHCEEKTVIVDIPPAVRRRLERTVIVDVPPQPSQWKEAQPKPALDPDDVLAIMAKAQVG